MSTGLSRRWRNIERVWFLSADAGTRQYRNMACLTPSAGGWVLEIWEGPLFDGDWVTHAEFADLESAKVVGRILAGMAMRTTSGA